MMMMMTWRVDSVVKKSNSNAHSVSVRVHKFERKTEKQKDRKTESLEVFL